MKGFCKILFVAAILSLSSCGGDSKSGGSEPEKEKRYTWNMTTLYHAENKLEDGKYNGDWNCVTDKWEFEFDMVNGKVENFVLLNPEKKPVENARIEITPEKFIVSIPGRSLDDFSLQVNRENLRGRMYVDGKEYLSLKISLYRYNKVYL